MKLAASLFARSVIATFVLFALASSASGSQMTYSGFDNPRGTLTNSTVAFNNFVGSLGTSGTDTIESVSGIDPTLSFGSTGITATTFGYAVIPYPPLAISGAKSLLDIGPKTPTGADIPGVFTFSQPVNGFGTFISQAGDGSANKMTWVLQNTITHTLQIVPVGTLGPNWAYNNAFFFGVTETQPFNRVWILESHDFDGTLLDNPTVGLFVGAAHAVPEPSTFILAMLGIIGVALASRARRK